VPQINPYSLFIGVGTIIIIRVLKRITPRVPGALVALVLMTIAVAVFGLEQRGVSVLGEVPSGLPSLTLPQLSALEYVSLLPGALAVCGITLADGLLVGRSYAEKRGYPIDANQEMFAFGAANVAGAVTGSFVSGSSGSRTAAMDGAGSRSQVPSVVGAGVVALVLVFFSSLLSLLPNAALGGIVANAVLALIEIKGLQELNRLRQSEFAIAVVCLASVLLLGTIAAVVIAFLLSVIDVVRRAASPSTGVLGELPGHHGHLVVGGPDQLVTLPGLVIYRFGAALFFANSEAFRHDVEHLVQTAEPVPAWFVLDAEAISDIDATGCDTLSRVLDQLQQRGVTMGLTRVAPEVRALLGHYELLDRIGEQHVYETNQAAVEAYRQTYADSTR
jgi:MFS superfamily sulfate permease-like transporter